jgi:hypothetical protein
MVVVVLFIFTSFEWWLAPYLIDKPISLFLLGTSTANPADILNADKTEGPKQN